MRIDYLFLDREACPRCKSTDQVLDEVLRELGLKIKVNKIKIESERQAKKYGFVASPTILINGRDIVPIETNYCGPCSALCGCGTQCRTFSYKNIRSDSIPKKLIRDKILEALKEESNENSRDSV